MEPISPAAEITGNSRPYRVPTIFLGIVVALLLFVAVGAQWKTYDPLHKINAVVLLFNFVLGPALRSRWLKLVFKHKKERRENDPDRLILEGYTNLFLAISLFA